MNYSISQKKIPQVFNSYTQEGKISKVINPKYFVQENINQCIIYPL